MPSQLSLLIMAGYAVAAYVILAATGAIDDPAANFASYIGFLPIAWWCARLDKLEGHW